MNRNHSPRFALALITAAALAACGGSNDDSEPAAPPEEVGTITLDGRLTDGPIQGAVVCQDSNGNWACDPDEPVSLPTDATGRFQLTVDAGTAGRHALVAVVPAEALDVASGRPVGQAQRLSAPATGADAPPPAVLNALTTTVAELMRERDLPLAEASARVQSALGLGASPMADPSAAGAPPELALASRALAAVSIEMQRLAVAAELSAPGAAALRRAATTGQLGVIATALGASAGQSPATRAAEAVAAVKAELNLSESSAAAVAEALARPANIEPEAAGPVVSLRRFSFSDAGNYSVVLFAGDSRAPDAQGRYRASEVRATMAGGVAQPFNRNQAYWTGSAWQTCDKGWEVVTEITPTDAQGRSSALYCGGARSESRAAAQDIGGQPMRAVIARFRAHPLPDSPGPHTDARGLPVNWGPAPALLPAEAVFPPGSVASTRSTLNNVGGADRIELANKSTVRWPDGRYRQATTLEQYGGMPGDLADPPATPSNANTVYVADLPLDSPPDATREAFKRYRAGFDVAALKIRFYACDVRRSDQAALDCETAGDGTLAIAAQGDARVMRVASGYPAALSRALGFERFWVERHGTVFRGARDLERLRHDQRLNDTAWQALRNALGIAAPAAPSAPPGPGPFALLRSFSYTNADNYSLRVFSGDSSVTDAEGRFAVGELRRTRVNGALQPFVRNRLFWTGSTWYDCPSEGAGVLVSSAAPPYTSVYCGGYVDERVGLSTVTLAGRRMADVVNDIRAYGSKDGGFDYGGWGPNPAVHTALATATFPEGAAMEYRGTLTRSTPPGIATGAGDRVRVPPADASVPFETWPHARSLDEFTARYPGDLAGGPLNGATAVYAYGYDLATPPSPQFTTRVEIRVAFDPAGQRARFYVNNRRADNNGSTNYRPLLDTTYTVQALGDARLLRFAALPEDATARFASERLFAERAGAVWYAFQDMVSGQPGWSIRLNREAAEALAAALGLQ